MSNITFEFREVDALLIKLSLSVSRIGVDIFVKISIDFAAAF